MSISQSTDIPRETVRRKVREFVAMGWGQRLGPDKRLVTNAPDVFGMPAGAGLSVAEYAHWFASEARMNARAMALSLLTCLLLFQSASAEPANAQAQEAEEQRKAIRTMARETIENLYRVQPKSRRALEGAAGYAVFKNFGMKLFIAGGGSGSGVAFDRNAKSVTYMKMTELQAGLGFRFKKYRQVWVFEKLADLRNFVDSGWEFSGQTTLSATLHDTGANVFTGAMSVRPGVWLYLVSDDGLALDATIKGAKYYPNKSLN